MFENALGWQIQIYNAMHSLMSKPDKVWLLVCVAFVCIFNKKYKISKNYEKWISRFQKHKQNQCIYVWHNIVVLDRKYIFKLGCGLMEFKSFCLSEMQALPMFLKMQFLKKLIFLIFMIFPSNLNPEIKNAKNSISMNFQKKIKKTQFVNLLRMTAGPMVWSCVINIIEKSRKFNFEQTMKKHIFEKIQILKKH